MDTLVVCRGCGSAKLDGEWVKTAPDTIRLLRQKGQEVIFVFCKECAEKMREGMYGN